MVLPDSSSNESEPACRPLSKRFWLWTTLNLLTVVLYLLPLSLPGTRILLLLGLAGFWTGILAAFWPYRWLRVVPVIMALLSFYPVRTG
jgi:hypothetical protein